MLASLAIDLPTITADTAAMAVEGGKMEAVFAEILDGYPLEQRMVCTGIGKEWAFSTP